MQKNRGRMIIGVAGFVILIGCIALYVLGDLRLNLMGFLWTYFIMSTAYVLAVSASRTRSDQTTLILAFAVLFRLVLLATTPTLSDDIYRYVWNGQALWGGVNPYETAPADARLPGTVTDMINYPDLTASYPPLSQAVFFIAAGVSGSVLFMKGVFVLFDLGIGFLLIRLLRSMDANSNRAIIYLWNPLVIVEVAGSGHNDTLPAFLLLASLMLYQSKSQMKSVAAMAGAALAKIYPLFLAPLVLRDRRDVKAYSAMVLLPYVLFIGAGWGLFSQLANYAATWRFNDSVHHIAYLVFGLVGLEEYVRYVLWLAFGAGLIIILRSELNLYRKSLYVICLFLLLSPTLHPWYLIWALPFLAVYPSPAFLALTGLIALSYTFYVGWVEVPAIKLMQYVPFYLILAYEARARFASQPRVPKLLSRVNIRPFRKKRM